jgi:hypothetical protein
MSAQPMREHLTLDTGSQLRRRAASVQDFAAFADIPMADCIGIVSTAQERQYSRRQTIFSKGTRSAKSFCWFQDLPRSRSWGQMGMK